MRHPLKTSKSQHHGSGKRSRGVAGTEVSSTHLAHEGEGARPALTARSPDLAGGSHPATSPQAGEVMTGPC